MEPTSAQTSDADDRSVQGREIMRLAPKGNVGIGDFSNNGFGLDQQPTQRLDVDGQVRIRTVNNTNNPDVLITGTQQNAVGDYVLKRKAFSGNADEFLNGTGNWTTISGAGNDCDWAIDPITKVIATASEFANFPSTECGQPGDFKVGIGTSEVKEAKLLVREDNLGVVDPNIYVGIESYMDKFDPNNSDQAQIAINGECLSFNSKRNVGAKFEGRNGGVQNVGVAGFAFSDQLNNYGLNAVNIGVYGEAEGSNNQNYAGYFAGTVVINGSPLTVSDEMFKENIEPMDNGISLITELSPKYYSFKCDEYPDMHLEEGVHCGLIAQELEDVAPMLVRNVVFPEQYDSLGIKSADAIEFKGVNYTELIPILIQATKEQQEMIDEKDEQIAELQQELEQVWEDQEELWSGQDEQWENQDEVWSNMQDMQNQIDELWEALGACCEDRNNRQTAPSNDLNSTGSGAGFELYQNRPNPFDTFTNISWRMATDAQAKIIVQDLAGQLITTLVDAASAKGMHNVRWETSDLPAGTYFYSLIVNGELQVKRAVKIK